jgi:hypothetical protein
MSLVTEASKVQRALSIIRLGKYKLFETKKQACL